MKQREKHVTARQATDDNKTRRMRLAFPRQQWLRERHAESKDVRPWCLYVVYVATFATC